VLESLTLTNKKGTSNPVCNATLYREKIIFVLGDNLTQLDSRNVSLKERKQARKRLSVYSGVNSHDDDDDDKDDGDDRLDANEAKQHHPQPQQPFHEINTAYQSSDTIANNENNNPNSSDVDQKVEFLSNLIERQARITRGLIEVTQNRNNDEIEQCAKNIQDGNGSHSDIDAIQVQVETALETIDLRRKAASTLVENVLIKDEQRRTLVRTALTQWRLLTRFNSHVTLLKSRFAKSETKWRGRANDLVAEAVKHEKEKGIVALRKVEEKNVESEESILKLNKRVLELESSLQTERDKHASFVSNTTDETDHLRIDLQKARVTIKQMEEELKRNTKTASVEIESIRDELQHTQKGLEKEKERNTRLQSMVSQISSATEEARNTATANSAELHDLKMQVISKDTLIEQLKNSLQKAATRAASDRSKFEQLTSAERQRGETLKTYTKKLRGLEADKQKLMTIRSDLDAIVSKKESMVTSLQQIVRESTSTISNLKASIEERDCKLDSMERRLKYVSEERDDIQRKISESKSLLDQAHDEVQKQKMAELSNATKTLQEHEMETMKLQQALDALRQTSQLREQELSTKLTTLRQKSQDTKDKQAKLIKSLSNKLKDAERSHRSLEELKRHREHEVTALQETLTNESESSFT
jgi:chromosome segregation ATPase